MKILSIGNSFSQDAHRWLNEIAKQNGCDIETVNLYIGGCSLEQHYNNLLSGACEYDLERNGKSGELKISVTQALKSDKWDFVTLQQASYASGKPQTYMPYISELAKAAKKYCPQAKLLFHQTWSYETDSDHNGFVNYNLDQLEMYRRICDASEMAAALICADLIPVGKFIQYIRDNISEFDYKNGGLSLCRDGYHLSLNYGRLAASAVWFKVLTGKTAKVFEYDGFDNCIVKKILGAVDTCDI